MVTARTLPPGPVQLMSTCLCDAFFPEAARATVQLLEHLGVTCEYPEAQTCCGQPAFNAGDWDAARAVIRHTLKVFSGDRAVVLPSGSCAAMIFHGNPLALEKEADLPMAKDLAARTWELADFIVNGLGIQQWPGRFPKRVAFHRSCHTRGSQSPEAALTLLNSIEGLELVEVGQIEQCCGFGGTFSVAFPNISRAMGQLKIEHLTAHQPDVVTSLDLACLMHLGGMMEKEKRAVTRMHLAEILWESLQNRQEGQS